MRILIAIVSIFAILCPVALADHGAKYFSVRLPDDWRHARRISLVIENLTAPANRAFKVRVTIKSANGENAVLGSAPIEAIGPTRAGNRSIPAVRLDVTRALRRILETRPDTTKVELVIEAVGARGQHIEDLEWDVRNVVFETAK